MWERTIRDGADLDQIFTMSIGASADTLLTSYSFRGQSRADWPLVRHSRGPWPEKWTRNALFRQASFQVLLRR
jgi:hypothetical protein